MDTRLNFLRSSKYTNKLFFFFKELNHGQFEVQETWNSVAQLRLRADLVLSAFLVPGIINQQESISREKPIQTKTMTGFWGIRAMTLNPTLNMIGSCNNTEKNPGDLRRLADTQTPVWDHWLTLVWITLKRVIIIIIIWPFNLSINYYYAQNGIRPREWDV